jgi:hypothetical protein
MRIRRIVEPPIATSMMNFVPVIAALFARTAEAEAIAAVAAGFGAGIVEYATVVVVEIISEVKVMVGVAVEVM